MRVSTDDEMSAMLARLEQQEAAWVATSARARLEVLRKCMDGIATVADVWVERACEHKGMGAALCGEEWIAGPVATMRNLRLLVRALEHAGKPPPERLRRNRAGAIVADVLRTGAAEGALFPGHRAEVWISRGKPASQGRAYAGDAARPGDLPKAGVCLVLGAGNVSSIPALDALYKLFVENHVVLLKVNPVNEYVGPLLERAFAALVEGGFLAIAYGGAEQGAWLAARPEVDAIHVTGASSTYDAIVWGSDAAKRDDSAAPKNGKPVTAELGCVTPVLVVPGPWSRQDLSFQAKHVASMVTHNASFNCNAAKVVVLADGWIQKEAFLKELATALAEAPTRKAYYPGAAERHRAFLDRYPAAIVAGAEADGCVPWTLLPDVPPRAGEYALVKEAFCGVLACVSLEASEPTDFLERAVRFANEVCEGTLSCAVLVHPSTEERFGDEVENAIASLRYGTVAKNVWPGMGYFLGATPWGAFPGHTPRAIGSGVGVVHNGLLFDFPEKAVVVAPFRPIAKPAYFYDHKTLGRLGRAMFAHERAPSVATALAVVAAGARG